MPDLILHRSVSQVFGIHAVTDSGPHPVFRVSGRGRQSFRDFKRAARISYFAISTQ